MDVGRRYDPPMPRSSSDEDRSTANDWRSRARLIAARLAVVGVAAVGVTLLAGGEASPDPDTAARPLDNASAVDEQFAVLSSADSNRCDLGAAELRRMDDGMRLQGSCCFPMTEARYEQQRRGLHRFRQSHVVPRDPYDISVVTAKRLLGYRDIALDRSEQAAYERATKLSDLGGPCCCPCWRWQAFKGQAHFLLARRGWSAQQVARLWDLEDGCGGPGEQA